MKFRKLGTNGPQVSALGLGCMSIGIAETYSSSVLSAHDNVIPIPGTSSIQRLTENAGAVDVELTRQELDRIDQIAPQGVAAGARYHEAMAHLLNG